MKNIIKDIKLHLVTVIMFGLLFPLIIWGIGLLSPYHADGLPIYKNSRLIGFENIGQKFDSNKYFWGRPSAVDYNAASTGGSNKGSANPEYLEVINNRIDHFLQNNPHVKRNEIPSDLITASSSGIDPHISPQAAFIQILRIAKERNIDKKLLKNLVQKNIEKPLLNLFGTERVNVLNLNMELDNLK
ncbi:MAG: potassium-transporting ATPase subunit KdpC [bacterium]